MVFKFAPVLVLALFFAPHSSQATEGDSISPMREARLDEVRLDEGVDVASSSEVVSENYLLSLSAPKSARQGEQFEFLVELESRGGLKVNSDYPLRMSLLKSGAFASAKEQWGKADARMDATHAGFSGRVRALEKGRHAVQVEVAFSVCSANQCLVEREKLTTFVEIR